MGYWYREKQSWRWSWLLCGSGYLFSLRRGSISGSEFCSLKRILIMLLNKLMGIYDYWSPDPPRLQFEHPRLHVWASTAPMSILRVLEAHESWLWCGTASGSRFSCTLMRILSKSWSRYASLVKKRSSSDAKQEPNHVIENFDSRCCVPLRQSAFYMLFKAFRPPHVDAKIHVLFTVLIYSWLKTPPPPLWSSLHASSPVFL